MTITLKLFAVLSRYLPAHAERNEARVELPDGASVGDVLQRFSIPREEVHLALVNGVYAPPDRLDDTPLKDGDALALWPPVAGG